MLSGLTFDDRSALEKEHLEQEKKEKELAKKQKKKEKKERQKKSKAKRHKNKGHSSDSGSDGEQRGSPRAAAAAGGGSGGSPGADDAAPKAQREDWMTVPMARSELFKSKQEAPKQEEKKPDEEPPVVGGIRYMKPEQAAAAAAAVAAREAAGAAGNGAAPVVSAAAGAAWRVRALQRAKQLAEEQGRGLNEVLSERWGSAAEFAKSLAGDATGAAAGAAADGPRDSRPAAGSGRQQQAGDAGPHYLSGVRSERAAMMRPAGISSSSSKLSWRRPAAAAAAAAGGGEQDRGRDRERDRDRDPDRRDVERRDSARQDSSRRDAAADGQDRGRDSGSRSEQQQQHRGSRDRGEDARDSGTRGGGAGEPPAARERRPREHEGSRDRDGPREGGRGREREEGGRGREREPDRRQEQQQGRQQQGRQQGEGRHRPDDRRQQQQRRQEQQGQAAAMDALKLVAGSMNAFANDGSFMDQLAQQQQQQDAGDEDAEQQQQQQSTSGRSRSASPGPTAGDGAREEAAAAAPAPGSSNRSTAELLRARLAGGKPVAAAAEGSGNRSVAELLRQRLSGGKPAAAAAAAAPAAAGGGKEVVHLPLVDAAGRAMPGAFGRESAAAARKAQEAAAGGRVAKRVQRYGADGKRERYFADDDAVDLQTLVKRAKHGDDSMDIDASLASSIARQARFKAADIDADAEYDHDAGLEMSDSRRKRGDAQQQAARERQRQVSQFARQQRLEDSCTLCFSSPGRPRELTIAVGQSTYLSLVPRGRLVDGHCCIVPAEHIASTRQVDEATWTEIRNFQKCLIQMFMAQGKEVLFLETATGLGSHRHHAMMEAIPMDADAFAKAPMYFKKALQESESEWAQHASKAVIDTKAKGLRGSIPPNFPYLYVQFGYGSGFVHVIDNEAKFDKQLGRQVAVGLLRLPPEVMHRRQRPDAPAVQAGMAAQFRKQWDKYDWTKMIQ